ncbi:probable spore coat protein DDB_G0283555 [Amphibalanus amphitrite]|uniref:BCS-4 n=1 Tax=Amphibalanus amphitrite TaxID=1232801 RepID=Q9NDT4_AMPAM|nr:probable spore coat protein DDB_G0283555 [Amphibalanus amphitrite]XP_043199115.1 probable spore coat protein DDB_G0283555 [Amphibalanus amphitrite]BAA99546.1 BCS-4 [Amphibalanus amphitrite]
MKLSTAVLLVLALCVASAAAGAPSKKLLAALQQGPGGACKKQCQPNHVCEVQYCQVCVPEAPSCKTWKCSPDKRCEDTPAGPVCVQKTCADIKCAAGEICSELPDGPDCVPDVPSCEGFFCQRGTNCYIRDGSPTCLPNTCEVRECDKGLTCIDTPDGALCRRGKPKLGCDSKKYCPPNSICKNIDAKGAHCVKI